MPFPPIKAKILAEATVEFTLHDRPLPTEVEISPEDTFSPFKAAENIRFGQTENSPLKNDAAENVIDTMYKQEIDEEEVQDQVASLSFQKQKGFPKTPTAITTNNGYKTQRLMEAKFNFQYERAQSMLGVAVG